VSDPNDPDKLEGLWSSMFIHFPDHMMFHDHLKNSSHGFGLSKIL